MVYFYTGFYNIISTDGKESYRSKKYKQFSPQHWSIFRLQCIFFQKDFTKTTTSYPKTETAAYMQTCWFESVEVGCSSIRNQLVHFVNNIIPIACDVAITVVKLSSSTLLLKNAIFPWRAYLVVIFKLNHILICQIKALGSPFSHIKFMFKMNYVSNSYQKWQKNSRATIRLTNKYVS